MHREFGLTRFNTDFEVNSHITPVFSKKIIIFASNILIKGSIE